MNKIVFLELRLFRNSMIETYQINELVALGYEVEIWYLGNLFDVSNNVVLNAPAIEKYVVMINSFAMLKKRVASLEKNSVIFSMLGMLYYYPILFKYIKARKDLIWIGRVTKSLPAGEQKQQNALKAIISGIFYYKLYRPFSNVLLYIGQKIIRKWGASLGVKAYQPDYLMVSNIKQVPPNFPKGKVIVTHADDYNIHLLNKNIELDPALQDAIVFLDQMLYFHPDFRNLGDGVMDVDLYYTKLNKLLDDLSMKYGKQVVIAGHPEADKHPQYAARFKGKKFVLGKSVSLVRHAALVVSHYSTAVNFATIYDKPLMLLTSNGFSTVDKIINPINVLSKLLKPTIVNIDSYNIETLEVNLKPDYSKYKEAYIKTDNTPEELSYPYSANYVMKLAEGREGKRKVAQSV